MIKVSIIVPVYNVEKYLKECLDSLIGQTLEDFEIICVNDGSTDGSGKILAEYAQKDKRIVIINQENQGQSGARNNAMKIAKGEYIAFVDSDDYISKDYFEKLYASAAKNNSDIVVGNVVYYENGKFIKDNHISKQSFKAGTKPITSFDKKNKLFKAVVVWNKIYKKELISNILFPENIKFEDNYYTFAAVFSASKISFVPSVNYFYRMNPDSIMYTATKSEKIYDIFKVIDKMKALADSSFFPKEIGLKCKQVLSEFIINTLYSWSKSVGLDLKEEFLNKTKVLFSELNLKNNPFIDSKTQRRYNKILGIKEPFFRKLAFFK